jgi:hypothetical protein
MPMKILPQTTELFAVDAIRPHERNVNQGDVGAIHESIAENGFFGSVLVQQSTGRILAGTHRWRAARESGATEIPATMVDVDDATALRIMLADNRTARLGHDDPAALAELLQEILADAGSLAGTGFDGDALDEILADIARGPLGEESNGAGLAENYSRKIEAPIYTPKGDRPAEPDLFDRTRTDAILAEIEAADLPPEVAGFLRNAAERHTVFRFDRIAEYYAHASAEVQDLMENSALVIIDFNKAVELGYVKLTEKMLEQAGYAAEADGDEE